MLKVLKLITDSLDIITTENLLQNEINKKVLNKLEAWVWQSSLQKVLKIKHF